MGKEKKLFKSEEQKTRAEISEFLHQIADRIEQGEVILRQAKEEIRLEMPHHLILEIQVEDETKSKGIQHSLEIEIKWYDNDDYSGPLKLA
ncbi:MAG: amphi-Trp domain-containing protein [Desulfobacterales bacterium]